jgi:hypothetical protein
MQDLGIVVGHDHLGPERCVDHAVVDGHGVVDDALEMQVWSLGPWNVHGCPHHILDQNSTVFQNPSNGIYCRVPVVQVLETHVYDAL